MTETGRRIWPFLIGRGVTTGNRLLLVPDYLNGDAVELLDNVSAPPAGSERSVSVVDVGGATVVHEARLVDCGDLIAGGDRTGDELLRDEHGRPIRVLYGFVVPDGEVEDIDHDDLARSWDHAVDVYRCFHGNESGFEVQRSRPIPAHSIIGERTPVVPAPLVGRTDPPVREQGEPTELGSEGRCATSSGRRRQAGSLVGAFAGVVVGVVLLSQLTREPADTLTVEQPEGACEVAAIGDSCRYEVHTSSEKRLRVTVDIEPPAPAGGWEVDDPNCGAVTSTSPCQITVRVVSSAVASAGDGGASLVVSASPVDPAEDTDLQVVKVALPTLDSAQSRPSAGTIPADR